MSHFQIKIKRVYETPSQDDGIRILVDRLWPRGLSKERARIDHWFREIAPSNVLRKWFNHEPEKWSEFRSRYFAELCAQRQRVEEIKAMAKNETVTLLFAASNEEYNNAVALRARLMGEAEAGDKPGNR